LRVLSIISWVKIIILQTYGIITSSDLISKKRFITKTLMSLATLFAVLVINFYLFHIMPGDPVRMLIRDPRGSPEAIRRLEEQFGLNKPLFDQFYLFLMELFKGNLGLSFAYRQPVMQVIVSRMPNTILLIGFSFIISTIIGILIGAIAGWKRGSKTDSAIFSFSLVSSWLPTFWVGTMLLLVFGFWCRAFPIGGIITPAKTFASPLDYWMDILWHMTLPTISLFFWYIGEYVLLMRSSMLDVLTEDYIVTAKAKGLGEFTILRDHAIRNALLPVMTLTMLNLGYIVAGAIQTEIVFGWPGLGKLIWDSLSMRDYPLLQGAFIIISISVVLANYLADVLYGFLDPRVE